MLAAQKKRNVKQPGIRASIIAALVCYAAQAMSGSLQVNPSGYRIIPAPESKTAFLGSAGNFQWVDNDRLLFAATDRDLSVTEKKGSQTITVTAAATIHLWDFKLGTIRRYRTERSTDRLCAADGRVRYALEHQGKKIVLEGPFGEEQERLPTPARVASDGNQEAPRINPYTCREYFFSDLPRANGGLTSPLRDEDGFFERLGSNIRGEPQWEGPLPPFKRWIHFKNRSREVEFPQETMTPPLAYSNLIGAYLFQKLNSTIQSGLANRIYLLPAGASVARVLDIPGTPYWNNLHSITITREGLVAMSSEPSRDSRVKWNPGPAGIYLINGAAVDEFLARNGSRAIGPRGRAFVFEQIESGLIEQMSAASPNGCKVVAVVDPWNKENRSIRLEAIDFCSKGR